jgi:multimeric flavodoxin WrbA
MRVLALNSSARTGGDSKTEIMLNALVEGMRSAGAEVEVVNLKDKKIRVCSGCYTCWTKTPGKCIHQDDMTKELFPKWLDSDLCILATPLFHHTVNATMKAFIERTLPVAEPYLIMEDDRWSHPLRYENIPGVAFLSVAGFPAMSAFGALQHYINFLFGYREGRLWAELYRPGVEILPYAGERRDDILDATRQAGRELVQTKSVRPETKARIEQPISDDFDVFAEMANVFWDTCIAEEVTPKEFNQKGLMPRPNSISSFMRILSMGFDPKSAGDARAVLQFEFSGSVAGQCHFRIADGAMEFSEGPSGQADLTIKTPFEVWIDIMSGKADGAQMFMEGRYTAEGNTDLLLSLGQWFGGRRKRQPLNPA